MNPRVPGLLLALFPLLAVTACGSTSPSSSAAAPTTAPKAGMTSTPAMSTTPGMGGMHGGKPNMNLPTHQVAPAVTAMLKPAGMPCGKMTKGSGTVRLIPVHVGKMSGPHVTVMLTLRGAKPMHKYGISGIFTSSGAAKWSGMAESDMTKMNGMLNVKTRLMPMLRAGTYTARILLHDQSCGNTMKPALAYETPPTSITLK